MKGIGFALTAVCAIAASICTFGAATPLAMSIVAGVTMAAGVLTGINAISTISESFFDYNFVRDAIFNGNNDAYTVYENIVHGVAIAGTITCNIFRAFNPIKGFTQHGYESAYCHDGHGVNPSSMINAVRHPIKTIFQNDGAIKYVGKNAVTILNEIGYVVTTWPRNEIGWRF